MRALRTALLVALAIALPASSGCATRLLDATAEPSSSDGAAFDTSDGGTTHAGAPDLTVTPGGGAGVTCGPNTCRGNEICCVPRCGICTFPGECGDLGCSG